MPVDWRGEIDRRLQISIACMPPEAAGNHGKQFRSVFLPPVRTGRRKSINLLPRECDSLARNCQSRDPDAQGFNRQRPAENRKRLFGNRRKESATGVARDGELRASGAGCPEAEIHAGRRRGAFLAADRQIESAAGDREPASLGLLLSGAPSSRDRHSQKERRTNAPAAKAKLAASTYQSIRRN